MLFSSKKTKLKSATTYWTQGTPAVLFFTSFPYKKIYLFIRKYHKGNITSDESNASFYDVKISSSLRREAMGFYLPFIYIVTN